ncbi:nuclear transport factor 2 family protein [Halioglobus maricola]|uniref:Nuclear transport factor 2 family protein n=1 Tax=Halioglobus maricola TaxID=2601894 RepID=A0A5P9NJH5_9GAMM|nr:nuclear transport factor 2 family protein [Halioglobus maricola]QFU75374.1 nuclear transport factor 2 family protein [Halioglobus maricola]
MSQNPSFIDTWHDYVKSGDSQQLRDLIHDDAIFWSPVVHTPQKGKEIVCQYLQAAGKVLGDDNFAYVREIVGERDAVLEFTNEVDGITVNGVDMIRWNDDGKIVDFKVMLRPLKAIQIIHQQMGAALASNDG